MTGPSRTWRFLVALTVALTLQPLSAQTSVQYVYDELGRLIAVTDATGDTATYTYDAVGNILSINRYSSSTVSIIMISPRRGVVGTTVTIAGTGFSTTASDNTVTFNGTSAAVTSATATSLVAIVPSGATTGAIHITTPSGTATSASVFSVVASFGVPVISSLSPAIGVAGASVTVTGTNFDAAAANDRLTFNSSRAWVPTATENSLSTGVPSGATSGQLTLVTPAGAAVSAPDFFVPPAPHTAADVLLTGRMTAGSAYTVQMATAGKIGLVLFEGTAGHRATIQISNVTMASGSVVVYDTTGVSIASGSIGTSGAFIDAFTLPQTGTYQILIAPGSTTTGNLTLSISSFVDVTGPIATDASVVPFTIASPGQNARLTFSGTVGQIVSARASDVSWSGCVNFYLSILKPDGTTLTNQPFCSSSAFLDHVTLPVSGNYTLLLDPQGISTGTGSLALNTFTDVTGSITPNGSSVPVTIDSVGQNAKLTFSGTAGQIVSAQATNVTWGGCVNFYLSILKPDGTTLANQPFCSSSALVDHVTLPVSGTYTLLLDPVGTSIGTGSLAMNTFTDVTGSINLDGTSVPITIDSVSQNAGLTFSGTVGQIVSARALDVSWSGCVNFYLSILKPDGTTLTNQPSCSSSAFVDHVTLPVSGTYTILLDPVGTSIGTGSLALYTFTDVTGSITPNGSDVPVTIDFMGQNAMFTFVGTAGQIVSALATDVTWGGCVNSYVEIVKPDGTMLATQWVCGASGSLTNQVLPSTGTYTLLFDPVGTSTGSVTLTVTSP